LSFFKKKFGYDCEEYALNSCSTAPGPLIVDSVHSVA
jgi:hypothetical protein